jgi:hypothetical protein
VKKKIEEQRKQDRSELAKEEETIEVDLAKRSESSEKVPEEANAEVSDLTQELLGKRENTSVLIPQDTKKVKVTMGKVDEHQNIQKTQEGPDVQSEMKKDTQEGIKELESKLNNQEAPGQMQAAQATDPHGAYLGNDKMGNMHHGMSQMMYPYPGYGKLFFFFD